MLGRRELSEAQVRQRLAKRGHDEAAIDAAVTRLKSDRSLDDVRVAGATAGKPAPAAAPKAVGAPEITRFGG